MIVVFFLYTTFFGKDNNKQLISGTNSLANVRSVSETKILGEQITQALIQIESLRLDRSIFDNPILSSLTDRNQNISSEPIGRRNPFAPLSDTSVNYSVDGIAPSETARDEESLSTQDTDNPSVSTDSGASDPEFLDFGSDDFVF